MHTNSDSTKSEKGFHLRIGIYIWNYYGVTTEKVSTVMLDEKVTVISSFSTLLFFVTEAGNALAALGNIHEGDIHILKYNWSKVDHLY